MTLLRGFPLAIFCLAACTPNTPVDAGATPSPDDEQLSTIAPVRPDQVCGVARAELEKHLKRIDSSCKADADCELHATQYDPCELPLAFTQGAEKRVSALTDMLTTTRTLCSFVAAPCAQTPSHAACERGRCVAREGLAPPAAPVAEAWEGALSSSEGPLAGAKVHLDMFEQVQCVTTPCDPMRVGALDVVADAGGVVRVALGAAPERPDYAMLTVAGYAPVRARLGATGAPVPLRLEKAK